MYLRVLFRQLSLTAGSVRRSSGRHSLAQPVRAPTRERRAAPSKGLPKGNPARGVAIMAHRPLGGHACVRKGIRQAMDD